MSNSYRTPELTIEQLEEFNEKGYILIKGCVSPANCKSLTQEMWKVAKLSSNKPKSWYTAQTPLHRNGFLNVHHHPVQWSIRTDPKIYNIFADLLQNDHLWVSMDRVCMKLPSREPFISKGFTHWDFDPWDENPEYPLQLQGVIALEQTTADMGGFHCVEAGHKWLKTFAQESPPIDSDRAKFYERGIPINCPNSFMKLPLVRQNHKSIPMDAGDLMIWRGELAHGNGENLSKLPRMAAYLTMFPADESQGSWMAQNLTCFTTRTAPPVALAQLGYKTSPQLATCLSVKQTDPIVDLSELGKRLVGLESWYVEF
jgi:ectoine hydroxylase-related dioxygenase (phytanoyl-CoA dioxygenase family)